MPCWPFANSSPVGHDRNDRMRLYLLDVGYVPWDWEDTPCGEPFNKKIVEPAAEWQKFRHIATQYTQQ